MSLITFLSNAPCKDADPWLFDQYQLDLAQSGLQYCRGCTFWEKCESRVEPSTSGFDGICGGKVWRLGKVLASLSPEDPTKLTITKESENTTAMEF